MKITWYQIGTVNGPNSPTENTERVSESKQPCMSECYLGEATHFLSAGQDDDICWQLINVPVLHHTSLLNCCSPFQEIGQQYAFLIPEHGSHCLQTDGMTLNFLVCEEEHPDTSISCLHVSILGCYGEPVAMCSNKSWLRLTCFCGNDMHIQFSAPCGPQKELMGPIVHTPYEIPTVQPFSTLFCVTDSSNASVCSESLICSLI